MKRPEDKPMYRVMVDDNFHYMDDSERYTLGEFKTLETAIAACRKFVDRDLDHLSKPGITAKELYSLYTSFGEDPFVVVPPGEPRSTFSAWNYAKQRASEMCGVPPPPEPDASPTLTRNEPRSQSAPEQTAGSQEESQTSFPKSDEWSRAAISLGVKMAEANARRMLALKTQQVWSSMGRKGPPPDL